MKDGGVLLRIKVIPGSSVNKIAGVEGEQIKLKIAAPPEKGKANKEVISFLAGILGLRRKDVVIESGEKSRVKLVRIYGVKKEKVFEKLGIKGESRR